MVKDWVREDQRHGVVYWPLANLDRLEGLKKALLRGLHSLIISTDADD
jgi:hypothetical protein